MVWPIGTSDFATAFLNDHLADEEDGIYIVDPHTHTVSSGLGGLATPTYIGKWIAQCTDFATHPKTGERLDMWA